MNGPPEIAEAGADVDAALARGVAALGLPLDAAQRAKLAHYLALLAKWNRTYNLTAIREPARMVTHHVLDSLAVLPHLPKRDRVRVLDVGSGGGLPGVPIAIARPDWRVVLVDPNHKKAAFLTQAIIELSLRNASAHAARVEDLEAEAPFDVVISRAFADLATFASTSGRHVQPGGALIAMKGAHPTEEITEVPQSFAVTAVRSIAVPGLDASRHLVVMERR
ncbi:MAG TPA: 16S rRNA (guanine(527)-N(7))-methyltransferase RsmG [Casimicrobiaceae bacterium]|nr:16S rRNA (guanine(527)-N(7))-methyltransferase RsmG [Casimicrobiaceae bacterium]